MGGPDVGNGAISVTRFPDNGTQLVETWVLSSMNWQDGLGEELINIHVTCHVSTAGEVPTHGTDMVAPHSDYRVSDTIPINEAPDEVRDAFVDQLNDMTLLANKILKEGPVADSEGGNEDSEDDGSGE